VAFGNQTGCNLTSAWSINAGYCNNNWQTWGIGSRTQWDVTKSFYLGVEVLYSNLHSAQTGTGSVVGPAGFASYAFGGATVNEANSIKWMVSVRAHRDFLP
jgi:hypothetical protein